MIKIQKLFEPIQMQDFVSFLTQILRILPEIWTQKYNNLFFVNMCVSEDAFN